MSLGLVEMVGAVLVAKDFLLEPYSTKCRLGKPIPLKIKPFDRCFRQHADRSPTNEAQSGPD